MSYCMRKRFNFFSIHDVTYWTSHCTTVNSAWKHAKYVSEESCESVYVYYTCTLKRASCMQKFYLCVNKAWLTYSTCMFVWLALNSCTIMISIKHNYKTLHKIMMQKFWWAQLFPQCHTYYLVIFLMVSLLFAVCSPCVMW